jgi:hypothetical protein
MRGRKGEGVKGRIKLLKEDKSLFGYSNLFTFAYCFI